MTINNDIFAPNSNLNLNFNNISKNIFSPLKNVVNDEDNANYYNPLFTNENNSIEIKETIKSFEKKEENYEISQYHLPKCQNSQIRNNFIESISSVIKEKSNNQFSSAKKINLSEHRNNNDSKSKRTRKPF